MAFRPTEAGPRNIRELYHWAWTQLTRAGEEIESGGGGVGDHPSLTDRDVADQHPTSAITGLDAEQAAQNDDIDTRVIAGYGGIVLNTPTAITIDINWTTLPADAPAYLAPVDIAQEFATNSIEYESAGEWLANIYFSMAHNESNAGRVFYVRLFDFTSGLPLGVETEVFVGRNQPGTVFSFVIPANIVPVDVGDRFQVQVGGTSDSFSSVFVQDFDFIVNRVSAGSTTGGSPGAGTIVEAAQIASDGTVGWSNGPGWSSASEGAGAYRVTFPTSATAVANQSINATTTITATTATGTLVFITEVTVSSCLVQVANDSGTALNRTVSIQRIAG